MKTFEFDLSPLARLNVEETGCDVRQDIAALRAGRWTRESLLAHCLDGADEDRMQGWREYVDAVVTAANEPAELTYAALTKLQDEAGQAGDRITVAICLIALQTTEDDWQRAAIREARPFLAKLGIVPEQPDAASTARAECARMVAEWEGRR